MPYVRTYRPVVVCPEDVAPSSTSPSSSPKAVRFPVQEIVAGVSRPLTRAEAWSLYHFEEHSRGCRYCQTPYETILNGGSLCTTGHALASDVSMHVYHRDGQVYSTVKDGARNIRVEVSPKYSSLLALLKALERKRKAKQRTTVTYDTYTTAPAVQPAVTQAYTYVHRSGSHSPRPTRYSTIIRGDDDEYEAPRSSSKDEKRGSLYRAEPRRTEYRVQVREPSRRHSERYHDC